MRIAAPCAPGRLFTRFCTLGLLLLGSLPTRASDGVEASGVGVKDKGRAGADVAIGDSPLSQFDNPASLTNFRDFSLDFGAQLIFPSISWDLPTGHYNSEARFIPIASTAVAMPLTDRWSVGFGLHAKSGLASDFRYRPLLFPYTKREVGADARDVAISLNTAYKLTDRWSVGIGGRIELQTATFSQVLGPADLRFDSGYGVGAGFQIGTTYKLTDTVTLGAAYRSPTWMGDVSEAKASVSALGLPGIGLGAASIDDFQLPQKVTLGAAWDVLPWLKLTEEFRWLNFKNSTLNEMTVRSSEPLPIAISLPLGYQDQWVFITAAEIKLSKHWILDLGYHFATNPIPRENLNSISSVFTQHHAATGLRYQRDNWWVGASYIIAFPTTMTAGGSTVIPLGADYAFGRVNMMQNTVIIGGGFSLGAKQG